MPETLWRSRKELNTGLDEIPFGRRVKISHSSFRVLAIIFKPVRQDYLQSNQNDNHEANGPRPPYG
jgi:hypothetical protein